jgi:GNAT superfamily N-acetyltransferase
MAPSDTEAVAAMILEFADHMRELGETSPLKLDAAALLRDGFGPRPAFEGLIAETEGETAGFLLHHDGYDTDAAQRVLFVVDLFVRRRARKLGIGATLIGEARGVARARGAGQLVWTVDRRNAGAVAFYERLGGRVVDWLYLMCLDA